jgi:hypothetical protein
MFQSEAIPYWVYLYIFASYLFSPLWLYEGRFVQDTDNYIRAAQILDLLRSGDWFDTEVKRYAPDGLDIYSRVVDLPYFLIAKPLTLIFSDRLSIFVAAFVVSVLLWVPAYIALSVWMVRPLVSPVWSRLAPLFAVLAGDSFRWFEPGYIDHHNVQILLMFAMVGCLTRLGDAIWWRSKGAWIFSLVFALSVAIGLETLPFIVTGFSVLCFRSVWSDDRKNDSSLTRFAVGFPVLTFLLLVTTRAPATYADPVLYRLSHLHLLGALVAGATAGGLSLFCRLKQDSTKTGRLLVFLGLGIVGALIIYGIEPRLYAEGVWLGILQDLREVARLSSFELAPGIEKMEGFDYISALFPFAVACFGYIVSLRRSSGEPVGLGSLLFLAALAFGLVLFEALRFSRFLSCFYVTGLVLAAARLQEEIARFPLGIQRGFVSILLWTGLFFGCSSFVDGVHAGKPLYALLVPYVDVHRDPECNVKAAAAYLVRPHGSTVATRVLADTYAGPELVFRTDDEVIASATYHTSAEYINKAFFHAGNYADMARVLVENRIDYIAYCPLMLPAIWPGEKSGNEYGTAFVHHALADGTVPFLYKMGDPRRLGELLLFRVDPVRARLMSER